MPALKTAIVWLTGGGIKAGDDALDLIVPRAGSDLTEHAPPLHTQHIEPEAEHKALLNVKWLSGLRDFFFFFFSKTLDSARWKRALLICCSENMDEEEEVMLRGLLANFCLICLSLLLCPCCEKD